MKKIFYFSLIIVQLSILSFIIEAHGQQTYYYGLEGWAAATNGGRGGNIIRVTNLNVSGSGSLAEALKSSGARIVVFEVGGVINLDGNTISISNPFITVAGQTAPSPGITVVNGTISIRTHDVIFQHIRTRVGAAGHEVGWEKDGPSTISASKVVIDHCSISWATDENCSASGPRFDGNTPDDWRGNTSHDITISNNIIAEGLSNATHSKGEHSKGSLIHDNATNIAILKNLYISNRDRNPLFKGGARGVVVNNYIYNPGVSSIKYGLVASEWEGHDWEVGEMSIVGNVLKYGPSTGSVPFMRVTNGPCKIYFDDNIAKDWDGKDVVKYSGDASNLVNEAPSWNDNIKTLLAKEVRDYMISHAGARPWDRDEVDQRLLNEMLNGTGKIIDYETEVGGYPTATSTNSPFHAENWNMDYLIEKSPELSLSMPNSGDTILQHENFTVLADTGNFTEKIRFVELLVNGQSAGKMTTAPYQWDITADSLGTNKLVLIVEANNGKWWSSLMVSKQVIADTGTGFFEDKPTDKFNLYNFPNPFSHQTTIYYHIPKTKSVRLRIFNNNGKMIADRPMGKQLAGAYHWDWTPGNLPDGTYFLMMNAGQQILRSKLAFCK